MGGEWNRNLKSFWWRLINRENVRVWIISISSFVCHIYLKIMYLFKIPLGKCLHFYFWILYFRGKTNFWKTLNRDYKKLFPEREIFLAYFLQNIKIKFFENFNSVMGRQIPDVLLPCSPFKPHPVIDRINTNPKKTEIRAFLFAPKRLTVYFPSPGKKTLQRFPNIPLSIL